jgi:hypothetical protein
MSHEDNLLNAKPVQHPTNLMNFTVTPIMMESKDWNEISRWLSERDLHHIVERIETIRLLMLELRFQNVSDAVEFKLRFT